MLVLNKDFQSIQKKAEEELVKNGIDNTPGSIARLFVSIINNEQAEFYKTLTTYHAQCFVSTASERYLDAIGKLLNCKRNDGEDDEQFRYRITKQCLLMSNANNTAIRLAALSVEGVDDVYLSPFSHGIGSFSIYILNDYMEVTDEIISKVVDVVNDTIAFGIRFEVNLPDLKEIEFSIKLMFNDYASQNIVDEVKIKVRKEIMSYILNLNIGEAFVLNEVAQIVMQQHDDIINYSILDFKVDGANVMFSDQYCELTEKFIVARKQHAIKVF